MIRSIGDTHDLASRYAVYFAPGPGTPLWRFGSAVIGYDAARGTEPTLDPALPVAAGDWTRWTEAPRRYGFHATLKAPFRLRAGRTEADLLEAVAGLARVRAPVAIPRLVVRLLGGFVAIVPEAPSPELDALAAACVTELEAFRAPLTAADRERRLASNLEGREVEYLDRYGYPYVLDRFRFHMTLTGALPEAMRKPVRAELAGRYTALEPGVDLDALSVFEQPTPDARFRILARFPLQGA